MDSVDMPSFTGKHCCSEVRRLRAALKIQVIPGVSAVEGLQVAHMGSSGVGSRPITPVRHLLLFGRQERRKKLSVSSECALLPATSLTD